MADLTDMSGIPGLLGAPSAYWMYPQQGYLRPSLNDYFFGDPSMGGMTPPDAPQAPPPAPVAPGGEAIPPMPIMPPPMPPDLGASPPGLLSPPATPAPVFAPPPLPPMAPPPPPGFGQPGFIGDSSRRPAGMGGQGRQGGGMGGGGFGSGATGGGAHGGPVGPGGEPKGMARGGVVTGERDGVTDNQVRALDEGEFVVSRRAADLVGYDNLDALNDPKLAPGIRRAIENYLKSRR